MRGPCSEISLKFDVFKSTPFFGIEEKKTCIANPGAHNLVTMAGIPGLGPLVCEGKKKLYSCCQKYNGLSWTFDIELPHF